MGIGRTQEESWTKAAPCAGHVSMRRAHVIMLRPRTYEGTLRLLRPPWRSIEHRFHLRSSSTLVSFADFIPEFDHSASLSSFVRISITIKGTRCNDYSSRSIRRLSILRIIWLEAVQRLICSCQSHCNTYDRNWLWIGTRRSVKASLRVLWLFQRRFHHANFPEALRRQIRSPGVSFVCWSKEYSCQAAKISSKFITQLRVSWLLFSLSEIFVDICRINSNSSY